MCTVPFSSCDRTSVAGVDPIEVRLGDRRHTAHGCDELGDADENL
jgi:hypothetical protein